jgi:hypothetical protein
MNGWNYFDMIINYKQKRTSYETNTKKEVISILCHKTHTNTKQTTVHSERCHTAATHYLVETVNWRIHYSSKHAVFLFCAASGIELATASLSAARFELPSSKEFARSLHPCCLVSGGGEIITKSVVDLLVSSVRKSTFHSVCDAQDNKFFH